MTRPGALHWGIVGGGLLGLTLAHRLARGGQRVSVFEGAPELGGLASAWTLDDVVWDRHYHVTLRSDAALRGLLDELGLAREMEWAEPRTGVYADGRCYSVSNAVEYLRFPLLQPWDKLRLAATIFYAARVRDGRRLEAVLVADWLRRWSGARTVERFWLPLLRAKLGDNYRITSAAFIWAIIARLVAARQGGLGREQFGYVPGGYARILARCTEVLAAEDVAVSVGCAVDAVEPSGDGRVRVVLANGRAETVDRAVVTAPAPIAARLCRGLSAEERVRLDAIRYQGILCASLLLARPLTEFYVTNIVDAWVPFTGVIGMSNVVDRRHFRGHDLIYLPKYVASDDPAFALPDEAVREQFLAALERMYPAFRRDDVRCFRLSRARHVLALATLDYSARLPPMRTSLPGVWVVNSAHIVNGTLNANETVALANRAASHLLSSQERMEVR